MVIREYYSMMHVGQLLLHEIERIMPSFARLDIVTTYNITIDIITLVRSTIHVLTVVFFKNEIQKVIYIHAHEFNKSLIVCATCFTLIITL